MKCKIHDNIRISKESANRDMHLTTIANSSCLSDTVMHACVTGLAVWHDSLFVVRSSGWTGVGCLAVIRGLVLLRWGRKFLRGVTVVVLAVSSLRALAQFRRRRADPEWV